MYRVHSAPHRPSGKEWMIGSMVLSCQEGSTQNILYVPAVWDFFATQESPAPAGVQDNLTEVSEPAFFRKKHLECN